MGEGSAVNFGWEVVLTAFRWVLAVVFGATGDRSERSKEVLVFLC